MKKCIYLLFGVILSVLTSCDNKQMNVRKTEIVGIWQNSSDSNTAIEFTENGNYYFRLKGERMIPKDSKVLKYIYDSLSEGPNLKIYEDMAGDTTEGILEQINPNTLKFSLVVKDSIVSKVEYTRIK
jgi:hypothetical protein